MKVLHIISGGETGGSRKHVVTLLMRFPKETVSLVVFQEGILASEARKAGIDVHVLAQRSRYDLTILRKLVKFIQEGSYDIVHTHGPRANLFVSLIVKRLTATWITTIHSEPHLDFIKSGIKGLIFTKLSMLSLYRVHYFFAVSERFKKNLLSLGIKEHKIKTIYNGIDFQQERLSNEINRADLNISDNAFVVSMVARLHPIKGHKLVIDAIQDLNRPNVQLLLIGDGLLDEELKRDVQNRGLQHQVHFLGYRTDVEEIYKISDLAILSSYSESFPLSLLEAAKHHVPVVTTDVGGVRELINSPTIGWVIPTGTSTEIKMALEQALDKKEQGILKQMGLELYEHASAHFSLEHLYVTISQTYYQFVDEKHHERSKE